MTKSKSASLKKEILSRFPAGYKLRKGRMGSGAKANTVVYLLDSDGKTLCSRDGHDYTGALTNLDFQTSPRQSPRLRLAAEHFSDDYRKQLAAHDATVGWAT